MQQPTSQLDLPNAAVRVPGKKSPLPHEATADDDQCIAVSRQQAHDCRGIVRRQRGGSRRTDFGFDLDFQRQPGSVRTDDKLPGIVLISARDLPGSSLVIRDRFGIPLDDANGRFARSPDDRLVKRVSAGWAFDRVTTAKFLAGTRSSSAN